MNSRTNDAVTLRITTLATRLQIDTALLLILSILVHVAQVAYPKHMVRQFSNGYKTCYPRESFREGLWNHRRTSVCPSVTQGSFPVRKRTGTLRIWRAREREPIWKSGGGAPSGVQGQSPWSEGQGGEAP